MAETVQRNKLLTRWRHLQSERASWMDHWGELSTYLMPRAGRFFAQDRNRGEKRHNAIYDNTGTRAVSILGAGMMAGMTSPARPWFRLATPDPDLNKFAPVKVWLSDTTRLMERVFQKSNTYRALHAGYEELGVFGTSAKVVVPNFANVVHHYPLTCGEYAIATNYLGQVDTLYRQFDMTVYQLVAQFGRERCSTAVQNLYDRGSLDTWVQVVHAIEPNTARDPAKRDPLNMAWKSCYFEMGAREGEYLSESGFKRFRALVSRWATAGGDIYGNSPGMLALGDVKQLQHEQLRKGQAIDFMTKPPLQAPSSMKNREVEMFPGGISFHDSAHPNGGIRSMFDVRLDLSHLLEDIRDVRERVNRAFYADLFLMLANGENNAMTATEVSERHEEKLTMLGPTVERLHNEELQPLIELTFADIVEAGILPPPPQELNRAELQVEFVSMLAQAQRAVATNAVDRYVGNLGAIAAFKPDVLDKFDSDKWADQYGDMLGVDPTLIVADDKVALIRKQRAEQAAALQRSAVANQTADTAQKLGNTPTGPGTAAGDVMQMFSGYSTGG